MIMKHKEHGFEIQIETRRGKPVVTKQGFVNIQKGIYKQCRSLHPEMLEEKFEQIKETV
jgi:hypothetical protein